MRKTRRRELRKKRGADMNGLNSCIIILLMCCLETACQQQGVAAPVGGAVLLPCLLSDPPASASVFWRDGDDNVVLDIKGNADDLQTQSPEFRGRVFGDRKLYEAGNFSILLKDVRRADAGLFECHVPSVDFQRRVRLTVTDERVEATPPVPSGAGPSGPSGAGPSGPSGAGPSGSSGPSGAGPPVSPVFSSWFCFFFSLSLVAV